MKNMFKIVALLSFGMGGTLLQAQEVLYLAKVPKNSVESYIDRFATQSHQIVITTSPVSAATQQLALVDRPGAALYVVEMHTPSDAPLAGEVARIDMFAVVQIAKESQNETLANFLEEGYHPTRIHKTTIFRGNTALQRLPLNRQNALLDGPDLVVNSQLLAEKLREFSGDTSVVIGGKETRIKERGTSAGKDLARAYLKAAYEALGYKVSFHKYKSLWSSGTNFVAEKTGTHADRFMIVSSHLDSMKNAGADDNGSGTIAALMIATALKDVALDYSIKFIAFDQEENGLVGSGAYVGDMSSAGQLKEVIGVLNLDVVGYDSDNDGRIHLIDCNENSSSQLAGIATAVLAKKQLPLTIEPYCTNRSDHASFWKYDVPAILLSENYFKGDPNPCMHKACDTMSNINVDYMTAITQLAADTVVAIMRSARL